VAVVNIIKQRVTGGQSSGNIYLFGGELLLLTLSIC